MSTALQYGKVACRIHEDTWFRKLSDQGQLLWYALLTAKEAQGGPPGLWCASDFSILDKLSNFTLEILNRERNELIAAGKLRHDAEHRLWWTVKTVCLKYSVPDNQGVAIGWARKLGGFERCPIVEDYLRSILAESLQWPETPKNHPREMFVATLRAVGIDPDAYADGLPADPQGEFALEPPAETASAPKANGTPVRAVFDHWCEVMQHPGAVLDPKRERVIRAALKLRSVEDCQRAIDGCKASAWHMGENDRGKVYDSITLILRDAEKIEQFIGYLDNPSTTAAGEPSPYRFDE